MNEVRKREERLRLTERFQKGTVPGEAGKLLCHLFVPSCLEPGKHYPLVLYLHGAAVQNTDCSARLLEPDGALCWVRDQEEKPEKTCFVLAVECPDGALIWQEWQLRAVYAELGRLMAQYPLEENRIYLTGVGMGAAGCWRLNWMYPNCFAAIAVCSPDFGPNEDFLEGQELDNLTAALVGKQLWLFHETGNRVMTTEDSGKLVEKLIGKGCRKNRDFFYTELPSDDVGCMGDSMYELGLMRRWMLAQDLREPPMPDHPGKPQVIPPELIPLAEQMARDRKERETYLPRFRERIQAANGIAVRYRLYVPNGMEKGKRYPLVLFLHGIGECGDDNVAPLVASDGGVGWVAAQDRGEMGPCFVLVPQCPYPIPGLRWEEEYLTLVEQALREVEEHFPVDRNRICLTGLSLGGFAVWNLVRMYPDRFAAAVTCCAGCLRGTLANHEVDESGLRECVPALEKIPLWMFHSADDPTVPVSVTKTMDAALRKLGRKDGPDYHVTIYPAEAHYGHACWVPAFQNPALRHWVMEQIEAGTAET